MINERSSQVPLERLLIEPLSAQIGQHLTAVSYEILVADEAGFQVEDPNASGGCQSVLLNIGSGTLEVTWGFDHALRDAAIGTTYHIQAIPYGQSSSPAANLTRVTASLAPQWKAFINCRLDGATVFGVGQSPQAIEFRFGVVAVVLAIGSTSLGTLVVGDGDEVLVFSGQEWLQQASHLVQVEGFARIWESQPA